MRGISGIKIVGRNIGFSTNSSSAHSVIICKDKKYETDFINEDGFGWEEFILADKKSKSLYFQAQMISMFFGNHFISNKDSFIEILKTIVGSDFNIKSFDTYIDHQSVWELPFNIPFLKDLYNFICKSKVVILGGNDNDEYFCSKLIEKPIDIFSYIGSDKNTIIKKDKEYYIAYNKRNGIKTRFTLEDNPEPYEKSTIPETVDLNITDFCDKGCVFCYKDCNNKGKHADPNIIKNTVKKLSELGVFEIALGGGEVTKIPNFVNILEYFSCFDKKDICNINFTTYDTEWLNNKNIVKYVIETVSGIGVSVHNKKDLNEIYLPIYRTLKDVKEQDTKLRLYPKIQFNIQHVFGSLPFDEFIDLLEYIKETDKRDHLVNLLFLGYKTNGRGKDFNHFEYTEEEMNKIFDTISNLYRVSVDTLFAEKYEDYLKKHNVDKIRYVTKEGKYNCYLDIVNNKIGPSSFADDSEFVNIDLTSENFEHEFLEKYSKF